MAVSWKRHRATQLSGGARLLHLDDVIVLDQDFSSYFMTFVTSNGTAFQIGVPRMPDPRDNAHSSATAIWSR